jgi:hypothetical protein
MTLTVSFSGGINHKADVSEDKQQEIADAIALAVQQAVEVQCGGGSGSVIVASKTASFSADSCGRAIDD